MYFGEAHQDKFIVNILKEKRNGFFVELGSCYPIYCNNTYLLESKYDWKGLMVEYENTHLDQYFQYRPNSIYIIQDATTIDYKTIFENLNFPLSIDYLQIDLEVNNGSTLKTLKKFDTEIFDTYKFATITFEHDIYHTNFDNTREVSREIFQKRGYIPVFKDVHNFNSGVFNPYEDWYVHPDLVDMEYVNKLIENNNNNYVDCDITGKTINYRNIVY